MGFFGIMKTVFNALYSLFQLPISLGGYTFSIGSMIIGLFVLSCSVALLVHLFND